MNEDRYNITRNIILFVIAIMLSRLAHHIDRIATILEAPRPVITVPAVGVPASIDPGFFKPFEPTRDNRGLDIRTVKDSTTTSTIPPDYSKP